MCHALWLSSDIRQPTPGYVPYTTAVDIGHRHPSGVERCANMMNRLFLYYCDWLIATLYHNTLSYYTFSSLSKTIVRNLQCLIKVSIGIVLASLARNRTIFRNIRLKVYNFFIFGEIYNGLLIN